MQIQTAVRKALAADERTVTDLARKTGIHRVNLYQFKAGNRVLPLDSLVTLADALGLEIVVLPRKRRV